MKVKLLAFVAKVLGVQFKIEGIPYGSPTKSDLHLSASQCNCSQS